MTQELFQLSVLGVLVSVLALLIRKHNSELAMLLGLSTCVMGVLFLLRVFEPIMEFIQELQEIARLNDGLLSPLLKSIGICILTQLCGTLCVDAGQGALGKIIDFSGAALCLYLSLPLFQGMIDLFRELGGGA